MKRIILALAVFASLVFVAASSADSPFPGQSTNGVFVSAQTVSTAGSVSDYFVPGDTVVFQGYAIQTQVHKVLTKLTAKKPTTSAASKITLKSFFVRIPLNDDIPMKYSATPVQGVNGLYRWKASWTIPALYPLGVVHYQVLARTWSNANGSFAQLPVAASQLTITATQTNPTLGGPPAISGAYSANFDVALYADAVNAAPDPLRPTGCTQTNVFKIGEKIVPRAYGYALADGSVLSMANVQDAHFSIPGAGDTALNWGQHGPTGQKVSYWTGAWQIPDGYPIGDTFIHIVFKTMAGKTGSVDYPITIIPAT